jgi:hypothetical protein
MAAFGPNKLNTFTKNHNPQKDQRVATNGTKQIKTRKQSTEP